MNSQKDEKFVPRVITLEHSVERGRRKVFDEESFVLIMNEGITDAEVVRRYGVSRHVINTSKKYYKEKYGDLIKSSKRLNYRRSMMGNQRGKKEQPAVVIPKEELEKSLRDGWSLSELARKFDTTEWFVRQNIQFHELKKPTGVLPYKLQDTDLVYLERLEVLTPGLLEATKNYYDKPHEFFKLLYLAFIKVNEQLWFIKELANGHRYRREQNEVPRDHICWSTNRGELFLSLGLLERNIAHERQFILYRNYMVDFFLPSANLLVEVDGDYHRKDKKTKERDAKKEKIIQEKGFLLLRVTDKEVLTSLGDVLDQIEVIISKELSQSE